ncbi:DUF3081 family protein [Neptuniibacter sp. QD48_11]|uniref:DUF3081 family protein n=1 Tax=unclassified Neptuniibacter TaxID=2630693 RepID=UPI0039F4E79C
MLRLVKKECQIDLTKAKGVFNYILLKGKKLSHNHYSYLGLEAIHNFDTCTLTLFDSNVKLNFTMKDDYQTKLVSPAGFRLFLEKIETISQRYR